MGRLLALSLSSQARAQRSKAQAFTCRVHSTEDGGDKQDYVVGRCTGDSGSRPRAGGDDVGRIRSEVDRPNDEHQANQHCVWRRRRNSSLENNVFQARFDRSKI